VDLHGLHDRERRGIATGSVYFNTTSYADITYTVGGGRQRDVQQRPTSTPS
jgi:hypothetical protein